MNRILFLLSILTNGVAKTILIPKDFTVIQEGINELVNSGARFVAEGTVVLLNIAKSVSYNISKFKTILVR